MQHCSPSWVFAVSFPSANIIHVDFWKFKKKAYLFGQRLVCSIKGLSVPWKMIFFPQGTWGVGPDSKLWCWQGQNIDMICIKKFTFQFFFFFFFYRIADDLGYSIEWTHLMVLAVMLCAISLDASSSSTALVAQPTTGGGRELENR